MRVFKFGGASVKDVDSVKNVGEILRRYNNEELIVVVSAMGKSTNALEHIMQAFAENNQTILSTEIDKLSDFHKQIVSDLFNDDAAAIIAKIDVIFDDLRAYCQAPYSGDYDFHYDQIISLGEILSTTIINAFLASNGFKSTWLDARKLVRTDDRWREGRVNWEVTEVLIQTAVNKALDSGSKIFVTQGFLGHDNDGKTTTLGREGSDFTASIFAYCLMADDVTIWKDVPGMLNADPKFFDNTVLLEKISFKEAIELAYFGASVIHPKTIQPLKRKKIPLYIKSFINPDEKGSVIQESLAYDDHIPSFIFKLDQVLISLTPRDFSFIVEENLERIFRYLNQKKIRVNLMQNSAVSFSFIVDRTKINLEKFVKHFQADYLVKYNEGLELVTVRHYDEPTLNRLTLGKRVILEQKSRQTARLVVSGL
ncbi:aspartate kinase [Crocinitomix sp.]|nr:aspartate kinase [Crocinitomix sp.]